ncbi:unnamed protein product [Clonostachys rosea]|uniref:Cuticle-degrading protease n=1 Tax=Bionectria ochroleuca TaxID=29856 RepID=A0ABY6V5W1_BIOOC|nr:unnamed protein product [Clonostachys rosea]
MRVSALLSILPLVAAAPAAKREEIAPLHVPRDVEVIPGKYIVKLKDGTVSISSTISSIEAKPDFEYEGGFSGFAGALTEAEVQALRESPEVEYVEQDAVITISATQTGAPWGIARLSNTNSGSTTYTYDDSAGDGTCAFVIDTGIYTSHSDFGGRASFAANYVDSSSTDGNGHGTHVAGTIGGTTYGVAKKTKLYAVKVLDSSGSGTTSGVIAGMNYVTNSAGTYSCPNGVVVNMSLGGSYSASLNTAANNIVSAGYFLAVAAGNSYANAANYSPASAASACTVGATTSSDGFASYSNYGSIVDILAPGSSILSTSNTGGTATLSGTSMASPHVAGLGAYYLGLGRATAANLCSYIVSNALTGKITSVPSGTSNVLAHLV